MSPNHVARQPNLVPSPSCTMMLIIALCWRDSVTWLSRLAAAIKRPFCFCLHHDSVTFICYPGCEWLCVEGGGCVWKGEVVAGRDKYETCRFKIFFFFDGPVYSAAEINIFFGKFSVYIVIWLYPWRESLFSRRALFGLGNEMKRTSLVPDWSGATEMFRHLMCQWCCHLIFGWENFYERCLREEKKRIRTCLQQMFSVIYSGSEKCLCIQIVCLTTYCNSWIISRKGKKKNWRPLTDMFFREIPSLKTM